MTAFLRTATGRVVTCLVAYMLTFASVYAQDYVWQIERIPPGGSATAQAGFEQGDLAFAWLDIPRMFFPLKITALDVLFGSQSQSVHAVVTNGAFYDHKGILRYVVEGPTRVDGWNRSRFGVQCSECEIIFNEGPIGIAEQFLGEYIDPQDQGIIEPLRVNSSHIATSSSGCWPGYNSVYDYQAGTWLDVCPGLNGNFTFRPHFTPLCPGRIGDIDGDENIDYDDHAILANYLAGPGVDQWAGDGVFVDHDNDYDVDLLDVALFQRNFTSGVDVGCPVFPIPELAAAAGVAAPQEPFVWHIPTGGTSVHFPPHAPRELERKPELESHDGTVAWSYVSVGITVVIGAAVIALVIGPCIQSSCRSANQQAFMDEGEILEGIEITRLRRALEFLEEWDDCNADVQQIVFENLNVWSNPKITENPRINRVRSEDDTAYVASVLFGLVVIHHSWITGEHWNEAITFCEDLNDPTINPQDCPAMLLAKILIAEGQHIMDPSRSERDCDIWLEQIMEDLVNCGGYPEGLGREFGHGFGGGCRLQLHGDNASVCTQDCAGPRNGVMCPSMMLRSR